MDDRKKKIKKIWQKIRFKYKLILLDESTLEDIFAIRISQLTAFLAAILLGVIFMILVIALIVATPLRNYLPGYLNTELRTELTGTRMRLDSLEEQSMRRTIYLENIRSILKDEISFDTIVPLDSVIIIPADSLTDRSDREQQFVSRFEDEEKYNLTILSAKQPGDGIIFYPPVKGVVDREYDLVNNRLGIEVLCARNASVATPLDGTIIFTGYTMSDGYVVQIQHADGYISVFRNLSKVLRQVNQSVTAGNLIGMMGNGSSRDSQPRLLYELWHKGTVVDPLDYINF